MVHLIHLLNNVLPLFYLISLLAYVIDFFGFIKNMGNSKRLFILLTLFIHFTYLLLRNIEFNHPPITNKFELFTVLAFTLLFAYFILELISDVRNTGLFIIMVSLAFQTVSSFFIHDSYVVKEVLRNQLLGIHVISALVGHSGITISAVYGILFLIQYHSLRSRKFGLFFQKLPSLEVLEKLSFQSVIIGYSLFTISILIGTIWLPKAFPDFNYFDPKLVTTLIIWLVYTFGIISKSVFKLFGKQVIVFSLVGFVFVILSMISTILFANSFHTFK